MSIYIHEAYFEISTPLDKNSSRSRNKNYISARLKQQSKYNFIQTKCFVTDNVMQVETYQKYNWKYIWISWSVC